jgi:hypothetical protein
MGSLVYLEILGPGKDLAAGGEGAGERLLPRMHSQVVHQLVLGLKGTARPRTGVPTAGMVGYLRAAHVLHRQVRHYLVHGAEELVAGVLAGWGLLRVDPEAGHLLLHRLPHVPERKVSAVSALQRNLNLCIPRKGIARGLSPNFSTFMRSVYSHVRPTYFPAAE